MGSWITQLLDTMTTEDAIVAVAIALDHVTRGPSDCMDEDVYEDALEQGYHGNVGHKLAFANGLMAAVRRCFQEINEDIKNGADPETVAQHFPLTEESESYDYHR